jgi:hypothetical protein
VSASPIIRWASTLSLIAAVLIVVSQILRLVVGLVLGSDSAATLFHTLVYGLALLAMFVLLLALNALFTGHVTVLGALGLVGYLSAFLGTLLVAGDWWFEAFAVPAIAAESPEVLRVAPGGSLIAGAVVTTSFYSVGWVLFGVATLRARVFPRPAAVLILVAGLAGPLALSTPYQIPMAIAFGWIGYSLRDAARNPHPKAGRSGN